MKDIRVGCWYERKYVLSPDDSHRFTPEVVGLSFEATYATLEEARQGAVDELEWLKAQVTAEVNARQQAARAPPEYTEKDREALNKKHQGAFQIPDTHYGGVPKDPAEVPDAEVWYGGAKGQHVSDLSLADIEFYLGSRIVIGASKDDQRVRDFVDALVFWRGKKGGRT